jgi:hypothetical protein
MLRNQRHISKAKKLVQNLTAGRKSDASPATVAIDALLANDLLAAAKSPENKRPKIAKSSPQDDPLLEMFLENQADSQSENILPKNFEVGPETAAPPEPRNSTLETALTETDLLTAHCPLPTDHSPDPWPLTTDHCFSETENQEPKTDTDPCLLETENRKPETENQLLNNPKPPPPYDETARRADELFEISHGYKRNNPPKPIPNRRRDEDFRSRSIFGDVKNVLKYM